MTELYKQSDEKHLHYVGGSAMGKPCKQCGATLMWTVPVELCEHGNVFGHINEDVFDDDFNDADWCGGAGLGAQYREPHGWGDHPPIESTDI